MATVAILAGGLLLALGIGWVGVQGLRGVPDSNGKRTTKGTAIAALILAILIRVGASILAVFMTGE